MKTTAVSQLKASLSEYLKMAKAGEEVIVTDRGKPMAKIVPIQASDFEISAHLESLERAGLARIGKGCIPEEFWKLPQPDDKEGKTLEALLTEREAGR